MSVDDALLGAAFGAALVVVVIGVALGLAFREGDRAELAAEEDEMWRCPQ